ncbi:unnamed protein product, partial [marine sediment metagenome]
GQELHIPIPEAFLTLEVFGKNGKLLQRHHQRSHSWVRNAYNHLFSQLDAKNVSDSTFGAGKLSIKSTSGAVKYGAFSVGVREDQNQDAVGIGYLAGAGVPTFGIQVGSGENAESFEDFQLQTQIAEGAGAGQLNHAASQLHSISYAALTLKDELVRYFNNNSGGTIGVNEVTLVVSGYSGTSVQWVQSRDKLPATVTVPDTGQLKVTYTIQLTYPA